MDIEKHGAIQSIHDFALRKSPDAPPFIRLPVTDFIEALKLVKSNNEALGILRQSIGTGSGLWVEVQLLKKALFKLNGSWKQESALTGAKQVLKCCMRLKSQNLVELVSDALESVLGLDGKVLMPSRQYMEFILVKLIGIAKLARQTIDYCVYTERHLLDKVKVGHQLSNIMTISAFISRIWVLSHTLLVLLPKSYTAIFSLHSLCTPAEYEWLPAGVRLPDLLPVDLPQLMSANTSIGSQSATAAFTTPYTSNKVKVVPSAAANLDADSGVEINREAYMQAVCQARSQLTTAAHAGIRSDVQINHNPSQSAIKRRVNLIVGNRSSQTPNVGMKKKIRSRKRTL